MEYKVREFLIAEPIFKGHSIEFTILSAITGKVICYDYDYDTKYDNCLIRGIIQDFYNTYHFDIYIIN